MIINAIGVVATGIVAVIIAATKFTHGAWLTIGAIAVLAALFAMTGSYYRNVRRRLSISEDEVFTDVGAARRQTVLLPIDELNRATMRAVSYARSISNNVTAIHVTDDLDEAKAKPWVEQRLHRLRHGRERRVLKEISTLKAPRGQAGEMVQKEKNYFAGHAQRMNYKEIADRGWPIGSGPVESSCRQDQCRFKRPGQSWTPNGFGNLSALDQARRNNHWDELWLSA